MQQPKPKPKTLQRLKGDMLHHKMKTGQSISISCNTQLMIIRLNKIGTGFCLLSVDNQLRTVYNLDSIWINEMWRTYANVKILDNYQIKLSISAPHTVKINKPI
jgi:hypothetical protein